MVMIPMKYYHITPRHELFHGCQRDSYSSNSEYHPFTHNGKIYSMRSIESAVCTNGRSCEALHTHTCYFYCVKTENEDGVGVAWSHNQIRYRGVSYVIVLQKGIYSKK